MLRTLRTGGVQQELIAAVYATRRACAISRRPNGAHLVWKQRNHGKRLAVQRHEFDLITSRRVDQDHGPQIAARRPCSDRSSVNTTVSSSLIIGISFHGGGYAVTNRGVLCPVSTNHTVRTVGTRPSGSIRPEPESSASYPGLHVRDCDSDIDRDPCIDQSA